MTKVQEPIISCATGIAQKAAEAALIGPQVCVDEMVSAYRARRDRVVELLSGTGLLLAEPHGAFYAMVDISAAVKPSRTFALDLVRDWRLAVAPGGTFGPSGDHAVRISLAADLAALEEGVGRLVAVLGQGDSTHTRG
jgi:aspartate aminotransferase/aminotransferase